MPDIIDLGGAPAEAECAQLGQTINFAAVNSFEVEAYRLAIVARYGVPPEGSRLAELANDHDFGTYRTLVLHVADYAGPEAQASVRLLEGDDAAIEAQLRMLLQTYPFIVPPDRTVSVTLTRDKLQVVVSPHFPEAA